MATRPQSFVRVLTNLDVWKLNEGFYRETIIYLLKKFKCTDGGSEIADFFTVTSQLAPASEVDKINDVRKNIIGY